MTQEIFPMATLKIGTWVVAFDASGESFPVLRIGYMFVRAMQNDPWEEFGRKDYIDLPVRHFVGWVPLPTLKENKNDRV